MSFMEHVKNLRIPLQDILLATKSFDEENYIGRGGFGRVYRGVLPQSEPHSVVAIKRLDRTSVQGEREFLTEIGTLSSCRHENLVSLVGFCDESGEKILVYEYVSNGSLDQLLLSKVLTWKQRLQVCLDAARGLMYLHHEVGSGTQHRVIHRDIKSANILLDENWKAKVADFGLSKISPANTQFSFLVSNPCGTFGYVDPQYLNTGILTKESDVFSFGVVLFEVLCGKLANFERNGERQLLFQLAREHYKKETLDEIIDPILVEQMSSASFSMFSSIAYQCIKKRREKRPSMFVVVEALEDALSEEALNAEELMEIPEFVVSRDKGCLIGDLGELTNLKGKLAISGLEQVESGEEAKCAKLNRKLRIEALVFEWKRFREGKMDEEIRVKGLAFQWERFREQWKMHDEDVLEGLRPHSRLKSLEIKYFKGAKFSSWMVLDRVLVLKNLVEIKLDGCDGCEYVPTLGRLANLKKVEMIGLHKVKKIGEEFYDYHRGDKMMNQNVEVFFPALRELVLKTMDMLEEWVDAKQVYPADGSLPLSSSSHMNQAFQFPNLEKLNINWCKNLKGVPSLFPSLKELILDHDYNSRLELQNMCRGLTCITSLELSTVRCKVDGVLEEVFNNNRRSLTDVKIVACDELTELPKGLFKDYPAMKSLSIGKCDNIKVIPDVGREYPISLQHLEIEKCGRLIYLPSGIDTLLSLRSLVINHCPLKYLPDLRCLTGLVSLVIGGFYGVAEIPGLPSSLECLHLTGWPKVKQLPQEQLGNLSALRELHLSAVEELEALPEWLPNLSSLQRMSIFYCENLKSMPKAEATRSLKILYIFVCPFLKETCVKGNGTDWPNIQHIPCIRIGDTTIQDIKSDSQPTLADFCKHWLGQNHLRMNFGEYKHIC